MSFNTPFSSFAPEKSLTETLFGCSKVLWSLMFADAKICPETFEKSSPLRLIVTSCDL